MQPKVSFRYVNYYRGMINYRDKCLGRSGEMFMPNWYQASIWAIGLLPNTNSCGLRMRRECRERFSRHRLQRKSLVRHARAVMRVGIANPLWRGKRSRFTCACANRIWKWPIEDLVYRHTHTSLSRSLLTSLESADIKCIFYWTGGSI